eukprot:CAMPEP_0117418620 /NCGR_PEP_ID=MMETSP0758-20121206/354_1 /TAXON_ID=63605 /ORGANISM="Percolomonas cosmopolitus, Strain AE-1 (ATCC 50343)" /LENGTH=524 /DNA_ID=CAMNT_0005199211 /DNA_START=421 /DNA_END=1991 /DNA_ORIENTATION=+
MSFSTKSTPIMLNIGAENKLLQKGINNFCVPFAIENIKILPGCFKFNSNSIRIQPGQNVDIEPKSYKIEGSLSTTSPISPSSIQLSANSDHDIPLKKGKDNLYFFELYGKANEAIKFSVTSSKMAVASVIHEEVFIESHKCVDKKPYFEMVESMEIRGKVEPPISGVVINVTAEDGKVVRQLNTNDEGFFSLSNIVKGTYSIIGYKPGYIVKIEKKNLDESGINVELSAKQLGGIHIEVVDSITKKPLKDAFIRVSNPKGFKFLEKVDTGKLSVLDLAPGTYYAIPILVEYEFEGSRMKEIRIEDGQQQHIRFEGKRIAYSCHGQIKSLNGRGFDNVVVSARSSDKNAHFEETTTREDGSFSIRGLKNGMQYSIKVKGDYSSIPTSYENVAITKDDIYNHDFVVVEDPSYEFTVSGVVETNIEYTKSIEVQLLVGAHPDTAKVVQSKNLPFNRYFRFRVQQKHDSNYYVRVVSSLNRHLYSVDTSPVYIPDESPVTLYFEPTTIVSEKPLEKSNQILLVLCVGL